MGQSKDGGYQKLDALTPEVKTFLDKMLGQSQSNSDLSAEGYKQFLPGGQGANAITNQANQQFQQQTLPSIMNAYGSNSKSSSSLNQALAAGAANLNTDIAAKLAEMQLQASQGLGNLSSNQAQLAAGKDRFAWTPRQMPFWQQYILAGAGAASQAAKGAAGGV